MILWRISNHSTLDGRGGLLTSGRWHSLGRPIVYLADSPASALLEVLVHLELDLAELPPHFRLLKVDFPDATPHRVVDRSAFDEAWTEDVVRTRSIGDEWLATRATALLRVPSAIVPETHNFLLNPQHSGASACRVVAEYLHPWDKRLF